MSPHRALLSLALAISCVAQSPKSITYLRLGQQLVEQRSQLPAPSEDWSDALRKLYAKAGIPAYQIVEQTVPGSSQKLVICTIAGRGDRVIVVSGSLARPKDEDAAAVAWASLAMLPLLAESLNAVSTDSTILFIAFPGDNHHHTAAEYVRHLNDEQRKKIKAAVEISSIGRGRTTYDVSHRDRSLADWLATAALALGLPSLWPTYEGDAVDFTEAKAFHSAGVPAITASSPPQRVPRSFSAGYTPLNKLVASEYYNTYRLLCVFLLDLDRVDRGASPKSTITPLTTEQKTAAPVFTMDEVNRIIVAQIDDERSRHGSRILRWQGIAELQDMTCEMAHSNELATGPFENFLRMKQLSGTVVVFTGTYPSLAPEQLQGLKVGRFQRLSVATCVVPSPEAKAPTYWIAALAYE